jgi:hypothetical protein
LDNAQRIIASTEQPPVVKAAHDTSKATPQRERIRDVWILLVEADIGGEDDCRTIEGEESSFVGDIDGIAIEELEEERKLEVVIVIVKDYDFMVSWDVVVEPDIGSG